MFALLAGTASAQQYLFQAPVGYAPTQQFAGVQQLGDAAIMPYGQAAMAPQYVEVPQYVEYPQAYAVQEEDSSSWSFLALCGLVGAAVGTVARTMFSSSSSPAESDL
jgi:hypothetical protein